MITYLDDFLKESEYKAVSEYCLIAPYVYGERDHPEYEPTGMTHNIPSSEYVFKLLISRVEEKFEFLKEKKLYRVYANIFAPGEVANYHIDHDSKDAYTLIYYPNPNIDWKLGDGGATEFYLDDSLQGIHPVRNRIAIFHSHLLHRATPFHKKHRFTIAIKYA
jgi:Rps23 Pro-64 3,4-dihydroxylase Tpa1-like proline 4-hydroxylase